MTVGRRYGYGGVAAPSHLGPTIRSHRSPPEHAKFREVNGEPVRPVVIKGYATIEREWRAADDWSGTLYRSSPPSREPRRFRAIPYHLWANREPGGMQVWIRADGA